MITRVVRLEYDGGEFSGWQRQLNAPSVQQALEDAWRALFSETITTTGASRTDAGVHARGQIAMFRTAMRLTDRQVLLALNSRLPGGVAVNAAAEAPAGFHARYGAAGKHYAYRLATGLVRPVLERHMTAHMPCRPDPDLMQSALTRLEGERDFTAFMDQGSPTKRPVRRLIQAHLETDKDRYVFHLKGDGFLYHMARIIVGTILMVGTGKLSLDDMLAFVKAKQRVGLGMTMPASGLCLERVYYDKPLFGGDGRLDLYNG